MRKLGLPSPDIGRAAAPAAKETSPSMSNTDSRPSLLKEKPSSALLLSATGHDYAEWFQLLDGWVLPAAPTGRVRRLSRLSTTYR